MADFLTELTKVAVFVFHAKDNSTYEVTDEVPEWSSIGSSDPILRQSRRASFLSPEIREKTIPILDLAFRETELYSLSPREGELNPMLFYPNVGIRLQPLALINSLLSSALLKMYYLRLPHDESTFVHTVIEGFEELKRAIRDERSHAYSITGLARVSIPEGRQISTPWGVIRPAPSLSAEERFQLIDQPKTRCILSKELLIPVKFDRSSSPKHSFDAPDKAQLASRYLLPLACALSSGETSSLAVPLITWSTLLLPFKAGLSVSLPRLPPFLGEEVDLGDRITEIEEWAGIVNDAHTPSVDIAAQRLVSAIAHRQDRSDALIDAVIVWENLFGTSSEVTFRVSASLTKLLENDTEKRKKLLKKISSIYNFRSRLIHGDIIDDAKIHKFCKDAIDISVKALRISYRKGRDWLSLNSKDRSDAILLE